MIKKQNVLWIILDLIFLIIFNAMFFILGGTEHRVSVWISYGFVHFAYMMLLLTPAVTRKGKSAAVFGFSIYSISSFYFLLELGVGVVFILVAPESYKAALLVQLCIAGIYGIALIANMIANEHTADAEEKRQYQIDYVKQASADLKSILENVSDKEINKSIEKVYDAIYSSPVKSHPNLAQTESQILVSINELKCVISDGDKDAIVALGQIMSSYIFNYTTEADVCGLWDVFTTYNVSDAEVDELPHYEK